MVTRHPRLLRRPARTKLGTFRRPPAIHKLCHFRLHNSSRRSSSLKNTSLFDDKVTLRFCFNSKTLLFSNVFTCYDINSFFSFRRSSSPRPNTPIVVVLSTATHPIPSVTQLFLLHDTIEGRECAGAKPVLLCPAFQCSPSSRGATVALTLMAAWTKTIDYTVELGCR